MRFWMRSKLLMENYCIYPLFHILNPYATPIFYSPLGKGAAICLDWHYSYTLLKGVVMGVVMRVVMGVGDPYVDILRGQTDEWENGG